MVLLKLRRDGIAAATTAAEEQDCEDKADEEE